MGKQSAQSKAAKKPSKAAPTVAQMVAFCVACFSDYMDASATLENAKALYDAARLGLRTELARAHTVTGDGRPWDAFKRALRAGLVTAKVCNTPAAAGRLINNALIALGLTGKGTNGKKKTGRPTDDGEPKGKTLPPQDVAMRLVAVLHWLADMQAKHAGDSDLLEDFATGAAIAGGKVKATRKSRAKV